MVGAIAGAAVIGGLGMVAPTPAGAETVSGQLPRLHEGTRNSLVVRLQRELTAHGRYVPDTGYFGEITKSRVKAVQRNHGWRATGVAGRGVWHVLLSDSHRVSSPSLRPYLGGDSTRAATTTTSVWDRLAQCESSGRWHINTGNGYYGGLQFSLSTWRAFGGTGMPNLASRAEQIRIAERVQRVQGWAAWPVCSIKVGLR